MFSFWCFLIFKFSKDVHFDIILLDFLCLLVGAPQDWSSHHIANYIYVVIPTFSNAHLKISKDDIFWYDALAGSCSKFPGQKYLCLVYMCVINFIFAYFFVFDMKTIIIITIIIIIIIIWKSKFLQTGRGRGSEGQTNWQQRTGKDLVEITIQIQIMMNKKIR